VSLVPRLCLGTHCREALLRPLTRALAPVAPLCALPFTLGPKYGEGSAARPGAKTKQSFAELRSQAGAWDRGETQFPDSIGLVQQCWRAKGVRVVSPFRSPGRYNSHFCPVSPVAAVSVPLSPSIPAFPRQLSNLLSAVIVEYTMLL